MLETTSPPPAAHLPMAPTVPMTPPPSAASDIPPPLPRKKPGWSWIVGALIPISFVAAWIGYSQNGAIFGTGFAGAFIKALVDLLLIAALWPMIALGLLRVPYMAVSVAGFGVPSPLGILLSGVVWIFVGKGLYELYHSRYKAVFWLIILAALIALGVGAYIGTGDYRVMDKARTTGSAEACDAFIGDDQFIVEQRGYCLIEAAVGANDPTMCDKIPGYQRTVCYNRLNAPYTPLPGMK